MPLVLKDRVRETSITVGTGTLTLDGAVAGFQSFAFIGNTNTTYYAIVDVNTGSWEVGLGTYTASGTTLSRDVVLESSAGGVRVNFSSSIKDVFCTYPAEQAVTLDDVQTLTNKTISSPSLTGTPTAPTAAAATNTTQVATTAHVFAANANTLTALSDANNTTKGAALVGDKGTNVAGALALNCRRPRKLFSKLFASASGVATAKIAVLGDSLAGLKMQQITASLDRRMGGENASFVNVAGNNAGAGLASGGNDLAQSALVGAVNEANQFQYWPTGNILKISAGGSAAWIIGGVNPPFTTVTAYYIKEPGAGIINLVVNGVTQATANANATSGLGVLTYTQAASQQPVSLTVSGAAVRVPFVHAVTGKSGVDIYSSMNVGGMLLSNATTSAQGLALWQAAVAAIEPDFVSFEMDDDFANTADANAFNTLASMLDAACPNADKLIIGSTPRSANDAGKLASAAFLKGACASRGAAYIYFDSYYLMGSYAEMTAIFGADDGTHPTGAAQAYAAEILWEFLGLGGFNLGFVSRAVNDRGAASSLARGTVMGVGAGKQIKFDTDASFGFDWSISYPRTLTFKNDAGTLNWQFSGNTAVFPNVMPLTLDFNSAGNVRKLDTNTGSGYEFLRFRKTDNPGGGLMHLNTGLLRSSFTRAELLAIGANLVNGAAAFCTDCTGGAQWVYAKGTSPTDWVTIDGKTAI